MRLDFLAQVFRCAANHQPRNEHRQNGKNQHAVEAGAHAAKHHFTELHHHHRHHAAQRRVGVVHRIDGTARSAGRHHGKQCGAVDAKTRFLAFHVAARLHHAGRLVHAQRRQQGVARLLSRRDGDDGHDKHHRHGGQHSPTLTGVTDHAAKGKAQCRRDQENRQHLQQIGQRRRVFVGMRRVGIEETTAVGAQQLDGFLRRHRAHGQRLRAGGGVFHHGVALSVLQRLPVGAVFGDLVACAFQRVDILVGIKVLDHTLAHEQQRHHQRQRHQQPGGNARHVHPEVADDAGRARHEPAKQGKHHGNAGRRRQKVLHRQPQHLREVAHAGLTAVTLPVGVGDKTDGGVERRVWRNVGHARRVQRQRDLKPLQGVNRRHADQVESQHRQCVLAPRHRFVGGGAGEFVQRCFHFVHPARQLARGQA